MCKCQSANLEYSSRFMRRTARNCEPFFPYSLKKFFLTNKLLNCDCRLRINPSAADAEWPRAGLV